MHTQLPTPIRKRKLIVLILMLTAIIAFSGNDKPMLLKVDDGGGAAFDASTRILNIGVGLGSRHYYNYGRGYNSRSTPALSISYEQALGKKVGPGFVGLGGYFGFQRATYRYNDYYFNNNKYYYQHSYTHLMLAFRAAYHLDALIFDKGEVYFGLMAGLRISTYKYENNSPDPFKDNYRYSGSSIWPAYSLFVGGRYYFTPKFGAFAELGYGISYLTLGLSLKI